MSNVAGAMSAATFTITLLIGLDSKGWKDWLVIKSFETAGVLVSMNKIAHETTLCEGLI